MTITDVAFQAGCPVNVAKSAANMLYPHAIAFTRSEAQAIKDYVKRVKTTPAALSLFEQYQQLVVYKTALMDRMRLVDQKQAEIVRKIDAKVLLAEHSSTAHKELFPRTRAALNKTPTFLARR